MMTAEATWAASYVALAPALVWLSLVAFAVTSEWWPGKVRKIVATSLSLALGATIGDQLIGGGGKSLVMSLGERFKGAPAAVGIAFSTAVFATALVLAACTSLCREREPLGKALRRQAHHARLLLYSAAVALAIGVVQMYTLLAWAASNYIVAHPNAEVQPLRQLAASSAIGAGGLYTLLLLLFFAPVAVSFHESVEAAYSAALAIERIDHDKWLNENGLSLSVVKAAVDILAILSPAITAVGVLSRASTGAG